MNLSWLQDAISSLLSVSWLLVADTGTAGLGNNLAILVLEDGLIDAEKHLTEPTFTFVELGKPADGGYGVSGLDRLEHIPQEISVQQVNPGLAKIDLVVSSKADKASGSFKSDYSYLVHGSGDIIIEHEIQPSGFLPNLPRLGLRMVMPAQYDNVTWYGRGPQENYPDRNSGAMVGIYNSRIEDMFIKYINQS